MRHKDTSPTTFLYFWLTSYEVSLAHNANTFIQDEMANPRKQKVAKLPFAIWEL